MATNVGSATGYLDLDISGFLAGLQSAQSAANTQTKNMATTIGNNVSGIGFGEALETFFGEVFREASEKEKTKKQRFTIN